MIEMKRIKHKRNGFTLLEMLAVLFIIGIVFSITLPTFGPIMKTMKLTKSAENLKDAMEHARQYAITSGEECYMVFPVNTGTDFDTKAYKVVYKTNTNQYYSIGRIETLPKGIEIDAYNSEFSDTIDVPFPEDSDSPKSLPYIRFKTNGGITVGSTGNNGHIRITETGTNTFQQVFFYNKPVEINIKQIGE